MYIGERVVALELSLFAGREPNKYGRDETFRIETELLVDETLELFERPGRYSRDGRLHRKVA